jgi:hypothetical protein
MWQSFVDGIGFGVGAKLDDMSEFMGGERLVNYDEYRENFQSKDVLSQGAFFTGALMGATGVDIAVGMTTMRSQIRSLPVSAFKPEKAVFAQTSYREKFSVEGRQIHSTRVGKPISSIDDLAQAIRLGAVKPSEIEIQHARLNGTDYILDTRSATALQRANVPRNQWSWKDVSRDPEAMKRLRDQLRNNNLQPGQGVKQPVSLSPSNSAKSGGPSERPKVP